MADQRAKRIASHRLNQQLEQLADRLRDASADLEASNSAVPYLRRARSVISEVRARLKETRSEIVAITALDGAASQLDPALNEIEQFIGNRNEAHLQNLDTHLDNLLVQIGPLLRLPFAKDSQMAVKAAKNYVRQLEELESAARTDVARLRASVNGLAKAIDVSRRSLDAQSDKAQRDIDRQKKRLDESLSKQQDTFSKAQERRINDFAKSRVKRESDFGKQAERLISSTRSHLDTLIQYADDSVAGLRGHQERAKEILGVTAATRTAGAFIEEADQQKLEADTLRRWALLILMLLLPISLIAFLVKPLDTDASVAEAITYVAPRLPIALALVVFAYLTGQSRHHRERERLARRLAIELTTFRPFLAELPDGDMHEEIRAAVRRYYKGDESAPSMPEQTEQRETSAET